MSRGAELEQVLDATRAFACRFVAFPSDAAADAYALWIGHCHAIQAFDSTPRLAMLSPEKGSGKTRAQEVAELLVPRPLAMVNISVPALFRSIPEDGLPPTLIMDEVDTIFGPKAPEGYEDLRGLLNAGHRRGRPVLRCVGATHAVAEFPSFAPVMLAGLGDLPDTIADRSVIVRMRKRAPGEYVEPFRMRTAEAEALPIADWFEELSAWMVAVLEDFYPELPEWLTDRPADVWEPIIAVADIAGGDWPERARGAARALLSERAEEESTNQRLLRDIKTVFGDNAELFTEQIITQLHGIDESPWSDWSINSRWLGNHLRPFGIKSKNIRGTAKQAKGYSIDQFTDAWSRYLSIPPSQASQAYDQGGREIPAVPGTDGSVPASHPQAFEQGWDGGTDGTEPWRPDEIDVSQYEAACPEESR